MGNCIIAMRSHTLAQKAARTLAGARIPCRSVSIDPSLTGRGCGYGISLDCADVASAVHILEKKNIKYGELIGAYPPTDA